MEFPNIFELNVSQPTLTARTIYMIGGANGVTYCLVKMRDFQRSGHSRHLQTKSKYLPFSDSFSPGQLEGFIKGA